jgi:hypothetical protein
MDLSRPSAHGNKSGAHVETYYTVDTARNGCILQYGAVAEVIVSSVLRSHARLAFFSRDGENTLVAVLQWSARNDGCNKEVARS